MFGEIINGVIMDFNKLVIFNGVAHATPSNKVSSLRNFDPMEEPLKLEESSIDWMHGWVNGNNFC